MAELRDLWNTVGNLFASQARRVARANVAAKIIIVVLTAIVAAAQFWSASEVGQPWKIANLVGATLALVAGTVTLFLTVFERDAGTVIEEARKALVLAEESENNYRAALRAMNGYDLDQTRTNELYNACARMRDLVDAYLEAPQTPFIPALQELIDTARRPLTIALGYQLAEHYTICIYVAEPSQLHHGQILRCVAHARTIDCPVEEARTWPLGVGVAGAALARATDVIVPKMGAIELGTLYAEAQAKVYDDDRYQSIAAVPVLIDREKAPWGVVVGTSDRAGHFVSGPGVSAVEGIRALAGMVALLVRAHRLGQSAAAAPPKN